MAVIAGLQTVVCGDVLPKGGLFMISDSVIFWLQKYV